VPASSSRSHGHLPDEGNGNAQRRRITWAITIITCVAIVAMTIITVLNGPGSIAATGLRELAILFGGALVGTRLVKS
jgi:hypothetical protein